MAMRLFTAIWPDARFVDDLDEFLSPRRVAEPRLRWTRPESWHITTAFMGEVPSRQVDRLIDELTDVARRTAPFWLRPGGGGAFPNPPFTKHLWLGFAEDQIGSDLGCATTSQLPSTIEQELAASFQNSTPQLAQLATRCRNAANCAGVRVDGTGFVGHLTLARANQPLDSTRLLHVLDSFTAPALEVGEFHLVQSNLNDPSHRYELLESFALVAS